jgi:2-oxoisovalerate dehydrogenase E1 component
MGRAGGYSDGRDIGVVFNYPNTNGASALPMCGGVGAQYTPTAGYAQAIEYSKNVLGDRSYDGAISVVLGGDAFGGDERLLVGADDRDDAEAADALLHRGQWLRHLDAGLAANAGSEHRKNLASWQGLAIGDGDGTIRKKRRN